MTDKHFSVLFYGIINSFVIGMTLLTLATGVMEGFVVCLIVSILILVVTISQLFKGLN